MTLIAKENTRLSNLVKSEYEPQKGYCRLAVTVNEAAEVEYKIGQVLGKVTATGKYIKVNSASVVGEEGAETAAAVVLQDVTIPAATDTVVLCLMKGPSSVGDAALILDAEFDTAAEKQAVYDALEDLGINVEKQI